MGGAKRKDAAVRLSTPNPSPTVHKSGPFLKMILLVLFFLGLAEACIPREVATEEKSLLSLQVLNEESNGCKEEVKFLPTTTTPKKPLKKKTRWNALRCTYMMLTFLFVSYNKGDWCYCHYCNPELDNRNDPCCAF
ncbi:epididymal protein 13 [Hippopotamus amphibius kiboko]|uniref:epididymal protein 13 n=1 Tax=Hippopotamus amphibius kiboko TaxID=575201 RepID=UPI0025937A57|nr:epididymal protein 13 [Hippopotamus amphibius kiboko]